MRKLASSPNQILITKKLLAADSLDFPIKIVNQNVGLPLPRRPGHHRRREYRRHPPRRRRRVPPRPVDKDHVPRDIVQLIRQVVDPEAAIGEEQVLNGAAVAADLLPGGGEEVAELADLGDVGDVVGLEARVVVLEVLDVVLALVEEDGAAAVVEGAPEEGLKSEAEDQQVAGGAAAEEVE